MPKVNTNISLDTDLKKARQEFFAVTRELPNAETAAALNEYYEMKSHPKKYPRHSSFKTAMNEVLTDA